MKNKDGSKIEITQFSMTDSKTLKIPKGVFNLLRLDLTTGTSSKEELEKVFREKIQEVFKSNERVAVYRWKGLEKNQNDLQLSVSTCPIKKRYVTMLIRFVLAKDCHINKVERVYESFVSE